MQYDEIPLFFECQGSLLSGIVARPDAPSGVGVVIVVGGPQYRVGSHRQYVLLARALADAGIACIRFDYRGMGDAEGDVITFESIDDDIRAAVDELQRHTHVTRVVLWALCDGASAALRYCIADPRIAGVVVANPWARSSGVQASVRLKHYYARRLLSGAFWRKLIARSFDMRSAAREIATTVRDAVNDSPRAARDGFLARMHEGLCRFDRPLLVILSANDLTAREFEQWIAGDRSRRKAMRRPGVEVHRIDAADHTFSQPRHRVRAERKSVVWILQTFALVESQSVKS
jgi:exosortase A-associated hydrolase 1